MSTEFEVLVIKKLDLMINDISELKADVAILKEEMTEVKADIAELKTDVAILKEEMTEVKTDVAILKKDALKLKTQVSKLNKQVSILKEDVSVLKIEVFNNINPTLQSIEQKVDIMLNINTATIINNQTDNYKQQMKKLDEYDKRNELEHSRLNYEICKLKANA